MTAWDRFVFTFFNAEVAARTWRDVASGLGVSVLAGLAVVAAGIGLGALLAGLRSFGFRLANAPILVFVDVFRALPPLAIILVVFFGLPNVGVTLPSLVVLWLSLSLVLAAFAEEVFWAGITSVPQGQWLAARSTGLSFTGALVHVVFPQAFRLAIPPLTNRTISITKNLALGSAIGVDEILGRASSELSLTSNATPLTIGAAFYILPRFRAALSAARPGERASGGDPQRVFQHPNYDPSPTDDPCGSRGNAAALRDPDPHRPNLGCWRMLLATSSRRVLRWPAITFIDFFRAFPPLVLIIFVYAGIPFLGYEIPALAAVAIAFFCNSASYYGEIYRAGMKMVPPGQADAARSTGLTATQTFLFVTFPQGVRNVLPDLVSNTVELVKLTTLASVVSAPAMRPTSLR
jgi:polar amino acid transport system permease protein